MKQIKVEWCENFIKATFAKIKAQGGNGIYDGLFWDMAEESGLWERGTYGSPMSQALANLTEVGMARDDDGNYLYTFFTLK